MTVEVPILAVAQVMARILPEVKLKSQAGVEPILQMERVGAHQSSGELAFNLLEVCCVF